MFMKNAPIFAHTHIHTNISGMGHMSTCSINIIYVKLMYVHKWNENAYNLAIA